MSTSEKSKGRNFMIVIQESHFQFLDNIIDYLQNLKAFNYLLACKHDGPEHPHIHIYVQFNNPSRLSNNKLFKSHFEVCRGSAQKNIEYLKAEDEKHKSLNVKSEIVAEIGEPKLNGGVRKLNEYLEMTDEEIFNENWKILNTVKKIKQERKKEDDLKYLVKNILNHDKLKVQYFTGVSGSGKTYKVAEIIDEYWKEGKKVAWISVDKNGFWEVKGSEEAELLILNEFRDKNVNFKDFLEITSNEHCYNVKGSNVYFRNLERIIITSRIDPHYIYQDTKEDKKQMYRRINEVWNFHIDHTYDIEPFEYEKAEWEDDEE